MEQRTIPPLKKLSLFERYFKMILSLKASDSFLFKSVLLICCIFGALYLIQLSTAHTVQVATHGGTFSEGIVGTPRFVNPVLAVTKADKDLSTLIYDGLMTLGSDGSLVPSIAESVTVSDDGLTYNVILKKDVRFSDDIPLTARDVAFTVLRIQDPVIGSPLRSSFDGVSIEEVGEYEINFVLPLPYSPFIENLSFGILPEHVWKDANAEEFPFSQHNSEPIGSGPYTVANIERNTSGIPETYILKANTHYHVRAPQIETIELHFFPSENKLVQGFKEKTIESVAGLDPATIAELNLDPATHHLERIPLPRTFAVFFNENKTPALRDLSARKALNRAINKHELVKNVLGGYGNALSSPVPPGFGISIPISTSTDTSVPDLDAARDILKKGGWKLNTETQVWEKTIDGNKTPLTFSLATVGNSTFEATAEYLRSTWEQLGVPVTVKQFEQSDLTQSIIRPRDYQALLFGTQLGRSLDYFSFWHSSQRNDPGLNVALYANITTDSILSEMRRNISASSRSEATIKFANELDSETPAIFLYAPELLYVFPNEVTGATFMGVGDAQERFAGVYNWYIKTESVWPFFTK